jgi:hypothetical protein
MINTYETVYITMDDICDHFGTKINDYVFPYALKDDCNYIPFDFDDDTYIDLMETINEEDPYNKRLCNEFDLMTYLRKILPNRDSCLIYVSF